MLKEKSEVLFNLNLPPDQLRKIMAPEVARRQQALVERVSADLVAGSRNPWINDLNELQTLQTIDPSKLTDKGSERYDLLFTKLTLGFGQEGFLEIINYFSESKSSLGKLG